MSRPMHFLAYFWHAWS